MAQPWYKLSPKEALEKLGVDLNGLDEVETKNRLTIYGLNEIKKEKVKSPLKIFIGQFKDILMLILLVATGLSIIMGQNIDALIIIVILLLSALLGFRQEYRSEKAVEALKKMAAPHASVLRNGKETKISTSQLVPGDILLLSTGDRVPADSRLIETYNLKIDEAALTGESSPVEKTTNATQKDVALNERTNMVFSGTIVVFGRAKAVVTTTGMNTEFGKIAKMVQTTKHDKTPLEKRMSSVGKWIGILVIAVSIGVGSIGIIQGRAILDMLLWAVSLAVAAVPVALPAIVTAALSVGMYRMAKVNTIVKRLPAVETLGCTSVICSDKTGTMTKGEMTAQRIYTNNNAYKVTGIGYEPKGKFLFEDKPLTPDEHLLTLLKIASLCNDSSLENDLITKKWVVKGDPTEGALVVTAAKANIWKQDLDKQEERIDEIPFSSERKCMTTLHQNNKKKTAYLKGAPEIVLQKCSHIFMNGKIQKLTNDKRFELQKITEAMSLQALRNLSFAYKDLPNDLQQFTEELETDFIFVGIIGMIDPPRSEVKDAIHMCKTAGIRVIMITGDHKLTATAVAKQLNLLGEDYKEKEILSGIDLDNLTDEQLVNIVKDTKIYARVSPEHKMRIVNAWKTNKQTVAMTGDGVNDAPALKMADIGISMGITGTEVTKEASDMILGDDNFASIIKAVKEGREIYGNIKKYLTYLLRCNIMEILVVFFAVLSVPLFAIILSPNTNAQTIGEASIALTAVQLLWINLTTDGLPALALSVDPGDPDLMNQKPRKPHESVFTKDVKIYLTVVPVMMTVLLLAGYFFYKPWENPTQLLHARTQLFTSLIVLELANALAARSLKYPIFKVGIFKNKLLWYAIISSFILQLFVLYTPGVQQIFSVTSPTIQMWLMAGLFVVIVFCSLEIGKHFASKYRKE